MADHLTEEEQIEALKGWWGEYWKSVVVPIVVALLAYSGWNYWQDAQVKKTQEGGAKYSELLSTLETTANAKLDDTQRAKAEVVAKEIVEGYKGSMYADLSNLILARLSSDKQDLSAAQNYLQHVANNGSNDGIKTLASTRLARVKIALGEYDAAIALVSSSNTEAYKSVNAEIRGDALAAQGKKDAAKTAYQEAVDSLDASQYSRRSIIQMKIDGVDILAGEVKAPAAVSEGDAEAKEVESTPSVSEPSAENS